MGHAYGDRVLTAIARRLEVTARSFGFAARLGGDEFMIVHEGAATIDDIVASGTRIVEAFQDPIKVEGRELIVSVSVGASVYPDHEQDAEALLRAADAALFNAKALGRSRLNAVHAGTAGACVRQVRDRAETCGARSRKASSSSSTSRKSAFRSLEVSLVEALIRWRMPDGQLSMLPTSFSRWRRNPDSSWRSTTGCCEPRSKRHRSGIAAPWPRGARGHQRVAAPVPRLPLRRKAARRCSKNSGCRLVASNSS